MADFQTQMPWWLWNQYGFGDPTQANPISGTPNQDPFSNFPGAPNYPGSQSPTFSSPPPYQQFDPNAYGGLTAPTNPGIPDFPTPPGVEPDVLPAQPFYDPGSADMLTPDQPVFPGGPFQFANPTNPQYDAQGNIIPGTGLSPQDQANMYNRTNLGPQSLWDELGQPTNYPAVGQFFKDAAGNIVDATGKIIQAASNVVKDFTNNIMNDPRNTTPDYLGGLGYHETPGGDMLPAGVTGPSLGPGDIGGYGAGGGGGSYFHGGASAGNPHGATSVTGAFGNFGAVSPIQLGNTSWGNIMAQNYLRRMMKGNYTSAGDYGQTRALSPSPWGGAAPQGAIQQDYPMFHQGQVQLHNFLQANPQWITQNFSGPRGVGQGPSRGPSPHLPRTSPV